MIPLVADHFFQALPASLAPPLGSGILLAAVAAMLLNLFFDGTASGDEDSRLQSTGANLRSQPPWPYRRDRQGDGQDVDQTMGHRSGFRGGSSAHLARPRENSSPVSGGWSLLV